MDQVVAIGRFNVGDPALGAKLCPSGFGLRDIVLAQVHLATEGTAAHAEATLQTVHHGIHGSVTTQPHVVQQQSKQTAHPRHFVPGGPPDGHHLLHRGVVRVEHRPGHCFRPDMIALLILVVEDR